MELGFDLRLWTGDGFCLMCGWNPSVRLRAGRTSREEAEKGQWEALSTQNVPLESCMALPCPCFLEHPLHSGFHTGLAATYPLGCHGPGAGQRGACGTRAVATSGGSGQEGYLWSRPGRFLKFLSAACRPYCDSVMLGGFAGKSPVRRKAGALCGEVAL